MSLLAGKYSASMSGSALWREIRQQFSAVHSQARRATQRRCQPNSRTGDGAGLSGHVKAGLHSYLTYLRDRLLLCRELLTPSGSIFVQISDENLHHVREVLDEVFGAENFVSVITFRKTSNLTAEFLPTSGDFILWFAKDRSQVKFRRLFVSKTFESASSDTYGCAELPDGSWRRLTQSEKLNPRALPNDWKLFGLSDLTSSHYYESPLLNSKERC